MKCDKCESEAIPGVTFNDASTGNYDVVLCSGHTFDWYNEGWTSDPELSQEGYDRERAKFIENWRRQLKHNRQLKCNKCELEATHDSPELLCAGHWFDWFHESWILDGNYTQEEYDRERVEFIENWGK